MGIKRRIQRFKKEWKSMEDWTSFPRRWTRAKKILRPSLFIVGLILAFVPTYFQQISVIRIYEGLSLPDDEVSISLNFIEPEDIHISFPYKIKNSGYYSLRDIRLKVSLRLDYTNIDTGNRTQQVIFSKRSESQSLAVGKTLMDTFYRDYQEFNWIGISTFLNEADGTEEVIVLMDIELSFYLTWVERDWIIISDIDLTSDLEQEAGVHTQNGTIYTSQAYSSGKLLMPFICIFIYLIAIISFLRLRQGNETRKKITNLKHNKTKDPIRRRELSKALLKIIIYTTIIVACDIFLLFSQRSSSGYTSEYVLRYQIAIWSSIFILILINCMSLLPVLRPKIFKKYSVKEGTRSLVVSFLSFLSLIVWSTTAIISYKIGTSSVVIRDTFISFVPFLVLFSFHISIKLIDLFNFNKFKKDYNKIRIEEERISRISRIRESHKLHNSEELDLNIFNAIKFQKENASLTQIRKYFEINHISKICLSGEKLNQKYLDLLVKQLYLLKKNKSYENTSHFIYQLTPLAVDKLNQFKDDNQNESQLNNFESLIKCPHCEKISLIKDGECFVCGKTV